MYCSHCFTSIFTLLIFHFPDLCFFITFQAHGGVHSDSGMLWINAFTSGAKAIQKYGGADVGMRTMLDALIPALHSLRESEANQNANGNIPNSDVTPRQQFWSHAVTAATHAAKQGMEITKTLPGCAGRSNYVQQELLVDVPDPGAVVVHRMFEILSQHFV